MPRGEIQDGSPLARVRSLCLALPETEQRESHGEPCWFAGGRKTFVMAAQEHHDDRTSMWAAAPEGVQSALVASEPGRYFRPPYVGHRGWVGVYLDVVDIDWPHLEEIIEDAWRRASPPIGSSPRSTQPQPGPALQPATPHGHRVARVRRGA